jgi:IS30 family transposase
VKQKFGVAMTAYSHLASEERDRIALMRSQGFGCRSIARQLNRSASTISREVRRNALAGNAYRPSIADGGYLLRRQRAAVLETDAKLAAYVTDRLAEGWTPEQIAGRLRLGVETGLRAVCPETIYGWIYRAAQKAGRLWRYLTRAHARRRKRHARASRDRIAEKTPISRRSDDADARETVGHWEADLVICKRARPVLVLHERKTRITLMSRLAGKTAGETIAMMMAAFRRLDPSMRGSVTFDNDTCFARHMLLRGLLSATTYFGDAYASWQKGGIENANGRIRRWLPRRTDLDAVSEQDIQEIAMTINLTPRKCLGYKSPVEAFLSEPGRDVEIRFA